LQVLLHQEQRRNEEISREKDNAIRELEHCREQTTQPPSEQQLLTEVVKKKSQESTSMGQLQSDPANFLREMDDSVMDSSKTEMTKLKEELQELKLTLEQKEKELREEKILRQKAESFTKFENNQAALLKATTEKELQQKMMQTQVELKQILYQKEQELEEKYKRKEIEIQQRYKKKEEELRAKIDVLEADTNWWKNYSFKRVGEYRDLEEKF
jgi:hypothetical protein